MFDLEAFLSGVTPVVIDPGYANSSSSSSSGYTTRSSDRNSNSTSSTQTTYVPPPPPPMPAPAQMAAPVSGGYSKGASAPAPQSGGYGASPYGGSWDGYSDYTSDGLTLNREGIASTSTGFRPNFNTTAMLQERNQEYYGNPSGANSTQMMMDLRRASGEDQIRNNPTNIGMAQALRAQYDDPIQGRIQITPGAFSEAKRLQSQSPEYFQNWTPQDWALIASQDPGTPGDQHMWSRGTGAPLAVGSQIGGTGTFSQPLYGQEVSTSQSEQYGPVNPFADGPVVGDGSRYQYEQQQAQNARWRQSDSPFPQWNPSNAPTVQQFDPGNAPLEDTRGAVARIGNGNPMIYNPPAQERGYGSDWTEDGEPDYQPPMNGAEPRMNIPDELPESWDQPRGVQGNPMRDPATLNKEVTGAVLNQDNGLMTSGLYSMPAADTEVIPFGPPQVWTGAQGGDLNKANPMYSASVPDNVDVQWLLTHPNQRQGSQSMNILRQLLELGYNKRK